MTRRHLMTLRFLLVLVDAITAAIVFLVVSLVRFEADPAAQWSVGIDVGTASILFGVTWVGVFWVLGLYRLRARWGLMAEARDIARGTVAAAAVTFALLFLLHQDNVSRLFLALLFLVQPVVMLGGRAVLRRWFEARRRSGRDTNFMLVVGTGPGAQAFADHVERHPALGMRVIGHLAVVDETASANPPLTRPLLGDWSEISEVFRTTVVDEVAVCLPPEATRYLEPIVAIAADEGKTVRVPRAAAEGVLVGAMREEFDGYLVHSVVHDGQRDLELGLKRAVDVVGSLLALVVLSPVFAVAAAAVRFADGAPVLFRQTRIGRHGRPFTVIKFRTMHVGADERIGELVAMNEVKGPAFKMRDDPRVSRVGRFLRRASIDELPQFLNVLRGEMSLVGPRPALPREVASYDIWHRRRLSVRPGMTGLWQVTARMEADFDGRAQLDLRYIDQWSLWMDLRIILRTLPAVFLRSGQ